MKSTISKFSTLSTKGGGRLIKSNKVSKLGDEIPTFCLCNERNFTKPLIRCKFCEQFFHIECLGITPLDCENSAFYFCENCRSHSNINKGLDDEIRANESKESEIEEEEFTNIDCYVKSDEDNTDGEMESVSEDESEESNNEGREEEKNMRRKNIEKDIKSPMRKLLRKKKRLFKLVRDIKNERNRSANSRRQMDIIKKSSSLKKRKKKRKKNRKVSIGSQAKKIKSMKKRLKEYEIMVYNLHGEINHKENIIVSVKNKYVSLRDKIMKSHQYLKELIEEDSNFLYQ